MRIMVDLHPADAWRIQERAEQFHITRGEVLRMELARRRSDLEKPDRVRDLVHAGRCDADIANELHCTNGWVGTIRRRLGLKPNRRYPHKPKDAA